MQQQEKLCSRPLRLPGLFDHLCNRRALAGAVAAHTTRPVIGGPIDSGPLSGFDALLSTVQMPGGIPVACVAVGKAGAKNAAYLAGQILALADPQLGERLVQDREANRDKVQIQNEQLQTELKG